MRAFPLLGLPLLVLLAPVGLGAAGVYAGSGPSSSSDPEGRCHELTAMTLYPSPRGIDLWAAEITCAYASPFNTRGTSYGYRGWPSHVADRLVGTPETGFIDSGTANVHGTSPGTVHWTLAIGPLGEGTAWSLDTIFYPDTDDHGNEPRASWWRGAADFAGVHV